MKDDSEHNEVLNVLKLTWLFFFSRMTVPSSISNSPWSFRHLTWKTVSQSESSSGNDITLPIKRALAHLDVEALWRLHVLSDVQPLPPAQRAHEGGQRLLIPTEPLQLNNIHASSSTLKHSWRQIIIAIETTSSLTSSAHMWKRMLAGRTLPYSQRNARILSKRSYLKTQSQR